VKLDEYETRYLLQHFPGITSLQGSFGEVAVVPLPEGSSVAVSGNTTPPSTANWDPCVSAPGSTSQVTDEIRLPDRECEATQARRALRDQRVRSSAADKGA
jgi:hypothetical protein